jgi:hypothetical protein
MKRPIVNPVYALLAIWCLNSCNDDEIKDMEVPSIEYTISDKTPYIIGDVTVSLTASEEISKAQFFIDGILAQEITPASKTFDVSWDSRVVADGTHEVKIVGTDKSENSAERKFDVTVKNTLIKFTIPPDAIRESIDHWIFLSDSTGKTIDAQQAQNGTDLVFAMPEDFTQKTVTLTVFDYSYMADGKEFISRYMHTYGNILPGNYAYKTFKHNEESTVGKVNIAVTNMPAPFVYNVSGPHVRQWALLNGDEGQLSFEVGLDKNPADFLFTVYNRTGGDSKYKWLPATATGSDLSYTYDELTTLNVKEIDIEGADEHLVLEFGLQNDEPLVDSYLMHMYYSDTSPEDAGTMRLIYPGNLFPQYAVITNITKGNEEFLYHMKGTEPPSTLKTANTTLDNFSLINNKFHFSLSGTADVLWWWAYKTTTDETGGVSESWVTTLPFSSQVNFVRPEIPPILEELYNASAILEAPVSYVRTDEYPSITDYNEMIKLAFQSNTPFETHFEMIGKGFYLETPGGRKSKNTRPRMPFDPRSIYLVNHGKVFPGTY